MDLLTIPKRSHLWLAQWYTREQGGEMNPRTGREGDGSGRTEMQHAHKPRIYLKSVQDLCLIAYVSLYGYIAPPPLPKSQSVECATQMSGTFDSLVVRGR